jgi:hypothetical protein
MRKRNYIQNHPVDSPTRHFALAGICGPPIYLSPVMPEFPDANTGGLDPTGATKPKAPLWKRVRAYTIIVALYAAILGMAAAAVPLLRSVFRPGTPLEERGLDLVYGVFLLLPLGFVLRYFLRLRLKTGRWRRTPEYIKQERAERRAKCTPATGCAPGKNTWVSYIVKWATFAAMDKTSSAAQRLAGWGVLTLYALGMLAMVAVGLICFAMAFAGNNSIGLTLTFVGFGIAVLFVPGLAVVKLVRGIGAGKLGATREDLEQLRAERTMQHQREWQKPLRSKIGSTAISCAILAFMWIRAAILHAKHTHANWVAPAMWTPALLYSIWLQFRRPKSAAAPNNGTPTVEN